MNYPNHHIHTYCVYLSMFTHKGRLYDMGVYINPRGDVSHAIIYGDRADQYMSGDITSFTRGTVYKENIKRYSDYAVIKDTPHTNDNR